MKDGAEGGLIRLLNDFADAAELGFTVNRDLIPFPPELLRLGRERGFDPMAASSSGVVLAAIPGNLPLGFLKDLMESHGFVVRIIGELRKEGREFVAEGEVREFPSPEEVRDPYPDLTQVS
ncbi:MAG: AIR synthase-related protein, partial [Candidatus Korarchaeota archaeon]|nr:AIR synthase-related protein [Candidatus Korarchaeota archaeon]